MEKEATNEDRYAVENLNYPFYKSPLVEGLRLVDGRLPVVNSARNVKYIKDIKLRPDDVFITGYPKSGTTWLTEMVWLLNHNLDFEKSRNTSHAERNPFLDYGLSHNYLEDCPSPRTLNTRLPADFLPENFHKKAKTVYIIRNPKDGLVSTYHYWAKHRGSRLTASSFEEFVGGFFRGELWYGPYWDHVNGYVALSPDVHIIQYENLLKNPIEVIRGLAAYLGKSYTDKEIESLVAFTSFKNIKSVAGFDMKAEIKKELYDAEMEFFRNGKVGDWKNYFSDELSAKVEEVVNEKVDKSIVYDYLP